MITSIKKQLSYDILFINSTQCHLAAYIRCNSFWTNVLIRSNHFYYFNQIDLTFNIFVSMFFLSQQDRYFQTTKLQGTKLKGHLKNVHHADGKKVKAVK